MVTVLPKFDPGAAIGQQFGQGLNQILQMFGQKQIRQQALSKLRDIDSKELAGMTLPQRLAALTEPFTTPGLEALGAEIVPQVIRQLGQQGTLAQLSGDDAGAGTPVPQTPQTALDQAMSPAAAAPAVTPEEAVDEPLKVVDTQPTVSNNLREAFPELMQFPEYKALAYNMDPRGMTGPQLERGIANLVGKGMSAEQATQRVQMLDQKLKERAQLVQGLNDLVGQENAQEYGDSPFRELTLSAGLSAVQRNVAEGRLEPQSVMSAARKAQKDVITAINSMPQVIGRPILELSGMQKAVDASKNWMSSIAKTDPRAAVQLLMTNEIPQADGSVLNGPDWGAVRATEIAMEASGRGDLIDRQQKFADALPSTRARQMGLTSSPSVAAGQQRRIDKGIEQMADYIEQMGPDEPLTTLRAAAVGQGYTVEEFNRALAMVDERLGKQNRELSPYQQWERSNILITDVMPSAKELLFGIKSIGDKVTGKY